MHVHKSAGVVWFGGIGHKLLGADGGSECYRCGMFIDDDAFEELIPDCPGPTHTGHHWLSDGGGANACAYGDARVNAKTDTRTLSDCRRA